MQYAPEFDLMSVRVVFMMCTSTSPTPQDSQLISSSIVPTTKLPFCVIRFDLPCRLLMLWKTCLRSILITSIIAYVTLTIYCRLHLQSRTPPLSLLLTISKLLCFRMTLLESGLKSATLVWADLMKCIVAITLTM